MDRYAKCNHFHQTFDHFFNNLHFNLVSDGFIDTYTDPQKSINGNAHRIKLRPGKELIIADFDFTFLLSLKDELIDEFGAFLLEIKENPQSSESWFGLSNNLCHLSFLQHITQQENDVPSSRVQFLEISVDQDCLMNLLQEEPADTVNHIKSLLENGTLSSIDRNISASSQLAIQQILHNLHLQTMRRLYLESKCMELLSLHIHEHVLRSNTMTPHFSLFKNDYQKILEAREILLQQMDSPPSIRELAKLVGLNDYKLKIGFKEMFGSTIYGLLRDKRLEKARFLIENEKENMNVSEVAYAIGYSNPSHFAFAFKKKYGVNPGELIRGTNRLSSIHIQERLVE